MELLELSIQKYLAALREGRLRCEDLVRFYLERIQRFDPTLNSIILVNPQALAEAQALDSQFRSTGELSGPLHGVPVLLKDNLETAGMPTTAGSLSLEGFYSGRDATIVRKLKEAGAIILAKTNLHEFAIWGETLSSVKGQTLNPYDLNRTPGGSSGGTGAALAANFGLVGIGTDSVNSVRSPSSANNLVGIRPSLGSVSRHGIVPYTLTQDTAGAMGRSVADVWLTQSVIMGYDSEDPATAWGWAWQKEPISPSKAGSLKGVRLGVLKSFFGEGAESEAVNAAMEEAMAELKEAGAVLVTLEGGYSSPEVQKMASVHLYELDAHLSAYLSEAGAPVKSLAEVLASKRYHPGIEENLKAANALSTDSGEYLQKLQAQGQVREWLMNLMAASDLDAMLYPHQQVFVCPVGEGQKLRNGVLASVTGFPSLCVPVGFSQPSPTAPLGVPIGMELISAPFADFRLLKIAAAYENSHPHRRPPDEKYWLDSTSISRLSP